MAVVFAFFTPHWIVKKKPFVYAGRQPIHFILYGDFNFFVYVQERKRIAFRMRMYTYIRMDFRSNGQVCDVGVLTICA